MKKTFICVLILVCLGILCYFGYDYYDNNGERYSYFDGGNIECQWRLKHGVLDGEYLCFYENGNIKLKEFYSKGHMNGESIIYFENGTINSVSYWINGYTDFSKELIQYYEDGQLRQKREVSGKYVSYYPNGNLFSDGQYDGDGNSVGEWHQYSETGEILATMVFEYGDFYSGDWIVYKYSYDDEGNEVREIDRMLSYQDGIRVQ